MMSAMSNETIEINVELHHETAVAWLISDDGEDDSAVWVPKSECELKKVKGDYVLIIPEWLAMEKGLI